MHASGSHLVQLEEAERHLEIAREGLRQDERQSLQLGEVEQRLSAETRETKAQQRARREHGLQMVRPTQSGVSRSGLG